jgi:hypothetical protein
MNLEITGKLLQIMEEISGEGPRGRWQKQEFLVETTQDKFPRKICFSLWGERIAQLKNLKPGTEVKVSFNLESREFQGRWFTDARAWQVTVAASEQSGTTSAALSTQSSPSEPIDTPAENQDDLPF